MSFDAASARALTSRLVACASVSPDVEGETRCARLLADSLDPRIERGEWRTQDGRPVVWAYVPGQVASATVLLGHYDTVGFSEYSLLDAAAGDRLALDTGALRDRFVGCLNDGRIALPPEVAADVHEEQRHPGTWMFGRGALDMKSALAVAITHVNAVAARPTPPAAGLLLVMTPDEEHESAGMVVALLGLRRMREERGLHLTGILNLDYVPERAAYLGAMGKIEIGAYVLGRPAHAAAPFAGVDAARLAAAIAARASGSRALVDEWEGRRGPPAVILRLRDLKPEYNVQTAREAWVEFNLLTFRRPLEDTVRILVREASAAAQEVHREQLAMQRHVEPYEPARPDGIQLGPDVLTWPELRERAGLAPGEDPLAGVPGGPPADAREATIARLRAACARARIHGPAVVVHLLPPYYPHLAPGDGPLTRAAVEVLAGEPGFPLRPFYPLITDACYAAWRGEPVSSVARHMPAFGREYTLPDAEARALDLDVVSLGPWGHDAHGLYERVHGEFAFERLPKLLERLLERTGDHARAGGPAANEEER
jgi:arginine utilization protein RocB